MTSSYPFRFFRVKAEEAERYAQNLVALYDEVYAGTYPNDECTDPDSVRRILEQQQHLWWVALDSNNDRLVSATVGLPSPWNRTYESCRSVTPRDYSGNRLGEFLYLLCLEETFRQKDADMTFGYPRTNGMVGLMKTGHHPITIVGSDLGKHRVMNQREVHLISLLVNPLREDITRVELPRGSFDHYDFVQSEILHPDTDTLRFPRTIEGNYPPHILIGPELPNSFTFGNVSLRYGYIEPSKSLEIRHVTPNDPSLTPAALVNAINGFVDSFDQEIGYLSLYVMADKPEHVRALRDNGFNVAAYLPGWFELDGLRFDSLKMAKRLDEDEPVYLGTEEEARKFTEGLNKER